jgi:hypothetical protein
MSGSMGILDGALSEVCHHYGAETERLTEIKELHVSVNCKLGRGVRRVARHQVSGQTWVDVDEGSYWLIGVRLALDPRSSSVVDS